MPPVPKTSYIYLDGEIVSWDSARVHILTHSLHYSLAIFEGTRIYYHPSRGSYIFRLDDHLKRLYRSAHILQISIPVDQETLKQATIDLVVQNHLKEGYIRHIVFVGDGAMGLHPQDNPIRVGIIVWEWGTYLGEEGLKKGVRCKISSYHRHHPTSTMVKAKTSANYLVSILAKREVTSLGYQEALLLDPNGFVAEGSGENVFIVRDGILKTPPTTYALEGITRDTVLRLARDLSLPVEIGNISRDELYTAEEAFLTGTAAEITPIREVDDRTIGEETPGKITRLLQNEYFRLVRGEKNAYLSFLTPLPSSVETKTQLQNF